jgi:8-oxo-dGTP pyrophosphatase MutT (NUDIX family)
VPRVGEAPTEVREHRQVGRQVRDRLAQQGGRWLTGGHEDQGYAARTAAVDGRPATCSPAALADGSSPTARRHTGYSDQMSHVAADPPGVTPRRLPAVEERSAGGVVVDVFEGEARIAVIARRNRAGRVEWCLPKGHIEGEETLPQTAAREVAEETGIEGRVLIELGTIDYWFAAGERRIHKYVHHYLLEAVGGHLTIENDPDHEAIDVAWLPLRDAHRHLTFPNERRIARVAWQRLAGDA